MVTKNKIKVLVSNLKSSAAKRGTEQGKILFDRFTELVESSNSSNEILEAIDKINKSLAGIEAHGFYTNEEFQWVMELRKIEDEMRR